MDTDTDEDGSGGPTNDRRLITGFGWLANISNRRYCAARGQ